MKGESLRETIFHNLDDLKRNMITDRQYEIMLFLGSNGAESTDLAEKFNISIPSASNQLTRLYKAGWITRINICDPTGGDKYRYSSKY